MVSAVGAARTAVEFDPQRPPMREGEEMSRSGYTDECENNWSAICWRGAVASAIRGKRGQAFLREMLGALDTMPEKRLISRELKAEDGDVCAIGAVGVKRGVDMSKLDPEEYDRVAEAFGISEKLAQEIVFMNDEYYDVQTPEERWEKMRAWVVKQINVEVQPV